VPERDGDRDRLVSCRFFSLHHRHDHRPMTVGAAGECRAVVCIQGSGTVAGEPVRFGDVILLPAALGEVEVRPVEPMRVLECGLGE
jgi:uncharacterized protein YjlB